MLRSRAKANFYRNLIVLLVIFFSGCEAIVFTYTWMNHLLFLLYPVAFPIAPMFIFAPLITFLSVKYRIWASGAEGRRMLLRCSAP